MRDYPQPLRRGSAVATPAYPGGVAAPGPGRRERHAVVSGTLAALDDAAVDDLLKGAHRLGAGIGGETLRAYVGAHPVFVKRIPLTDVEREPGRYRSTGNLFELPSFCHYGIGSPGFGAWREIAAHELTTGWELDEQARCFPLAYHWRVVPTNPPTLQDELADIDATVQFWDGSAAVRARIEAIATASAAVLVFLEYVPQTLDRWLGERLAEGPGRADRACALIERELHRCADLMAANGFLHLDAHFENVLTDGSRLYFADLGLAMSEDFELSATERDFHGRHLSFDRSYVFAQLSRRLNGTGRKPSPAARRILERYEPVVDAVRPFYRALQAESRSTPYPVETERAAWRQVSRTP